MPRFNPGPNKTENTDGPGRIQIGSAEQNLPSRVQDQENAAPAAWVKPAAIGGGVLALGLVAAFMMAGGGDDAPPVAMPQPPVAQAPAPDVITPAPAPPVVAAPRLPSAQEILADSIQEKYAVVPGGSRYQAFYTAAGREARAGQDFAVYVGLSFDGGIVNVLVAEGPYAGSLVRFTPFVGSGEGRFKVEHARVGEMVAGADGATPQFKSFPDHAITDREVVLRADAERQAALANGWLPATERQPVAEVTLRDSARELEKWVTDANGEQGRAFTLVGQPEKDGIFSVITPNGDSYRFNLQTGEFTLDSVYLFYPDIDREIDTAYNPDHPDYRAIRLQHGCSLNPEVDCYLVDPGKDFPSVVNGVVPGVAEPVLRQQVNPPGLVPTGP